MVKDEIRRHFGTPEAKLHVIYNGIDLETFHPRLRDAHRASLRQRLGIPPQAFVFLHVGAGFERKGVFRLIEAFAQSALKDSRLLIVGSDKTQARGRAPRSLVRPRVARPFRRDPGRRAPVVRRRGRFRARDALRSVSERGAGGDGVRPAGSSPRTRAVRRRSSRRG